MRMAKSSQEEMEKMLAFFEGLESIFEGNFEQESMFGDYDEDLRDAIGKYVMEQWNFLSSSWARFYWGFHTVLESVIDPSLDYLEFKPEIKQKLEGPQAKEGELSSE